MNTLPPLSPEDAKEVIGLKFGENQEETPLSAVSAVVTGIALLEAGVDIETIATIDLDSDPDFFEFVLGLTLNAHRKHNVIGPTLQQITDALPGAFRLNMAVITRTIMAAALDEEITTPVARVTAADERLQRTKVVLADPDGLERTLGTMRMIVAELQKNTQINQKYKDSQKGGTNDLFPENETDRDNTELRREQLVDHRILDLGELAAANARAGVVIRTMLVKAVDAKSLGLRPPAAK